MHLPDNLQEGQKKEIQMNEQEVKTINFGSLKIHGLLLNTEAIKGNFILAAVETLDNQIDFNAIYITNPPTSPDFDYELKQYRENLGRSIRQDPIAKFKAVVVKFNNFLEFIYAVAIRSSGQFDLYFNGFKVYSSTPTCNY